MKFLQILKKACLLSYSIAFRAFFCPPQCNFSVVFALPFWLPFTVRLHMFASGHAQMLLLLCKPMVLYVCTYVCVGICIFCVRLQRIIYVCVIIHFSSINQYWLIVSVLIVWPPTNFSLTHQYKPKAEQSGQLSSKRVCVCVCANKSLNAFVQRIWALMHSRTTLLCPIFDTKPFLHLQTFMATKSVTFHPKATLKKMSKL